MHMHAFTRTTKAPRRGTYPTLADSHAIRACAQQHASTSARTCISPEHSYVSEARRPCRRPPLVVASVKPSHHDVPFSYSGAATCRTALSARLLPGSSPTPSVQESDETTVRPMRGEAPGAPARVPECTTQQESCQLLHTPVTASPRRCWRHARRQGRPRPTSIPWRDCGQGVHLPPTSLSLRGASHGA